MCDPVSFGAATVGLQAVGSTAKFVQAGKNADRIQDRYDKTAAMAEEARQRNLARLDRRLQQEREAAGQRVDDVVRAAEEAEGYNVAAAAAAGISGDALTNVLMEIERSATTRITRELTNLENVQDQIRAEKEGVVDRQYNTLLATPQGSKPSLLVPFFEVASAGLSAYGNAAFSEP